MANISFDSSTFSRDDFEKLVDTRFTQLSADVSGSYFKLYMNGLQPERYYQVLIQTTINGSTLVYNDGYYFKVING